MFDSIPLHSDTLEYIFPVDSITETESYKPIFTEEIPFKPGLDTYPLHRNIPDDITPDWIFYIILILLGTVSWLRVFNSKNLINNFTALINYQLTTKLYNENNIIQRRASALLHSIYFFSGGLYLFLIFNHFQWHPAHLSGFILFLCLTGFLILLFLIRIFLMKLTGFIFVRKELFSTYLFHYYLTNKVLGLIFIPLTIAIAYTSGVLPEIIIYISFFIVLSAYILRLLRTFLFVLKNEILLFYLILYLCAVEILPFLVILKVILSLVKVF